MPTFVILQNGEELGRIQGADPGGLEHLIATLVASRAGVVAGISSKPIGEHVANAAERQWLERLVSLAEKVILRKTKLYEILKNFRCRFMKIPSVKQLLSHLFPQMNFAKKQQ